MVIPAEIRQGAQPPGLPGAEPAFHPLALNMPDTVAHFDRQARFVYANPALERVLGMTAADLLGKRFSDIAPGLPGLLAYQQAIESVLATGEDMNIDLLICRQPDGGRAGGAAITPMMAGQLDMQSEGQRVDQVRMVALKDAEDSVTGVLALGRDVTNLKRMEAAREGALKAAERLALTKSAFLANMSHEIRTPLNAVLGMAQLGLRESRASKTRSRFASILDAGQLLLSLVNDILDFSKIEAGKLHLEPDIVNLGLVIDRAVDLIAPRAWAKGIDILVDEGEALPQLFHGDSLRIIQILVNLLSNAVKFTEQGGVCLGVRQDGDNLVFTVTDTGIGMTEAQTQNLFAPFEQADGSTTRRFGGTGLGLAISKRLSDMMAGTLSVRSVPEEGTEFEFSLPVSEMVPNQPASGAGTVRLAGLGCADGLSEALSLHGVATEVVPLDAAFAAPARLIVLPYAALEGRLLGQARAALASGLNLAVVIPPGGMYAIPADLRDRLRYIDWPSRARHVLNLLAGENHAPDPEPKTAEVDLAGIKILAAEDNELNRVVLREMLTVAGADLVCVENGRELVERLQLDGPSAYDIVITDVQMPEMDGYTVARRVRELAPTLPVIGLTAYAMADERQRCLEAGMSAHLGKPVNMDNLIATVLGLVRKGGMPSTLSGETTPASPCPTGRSIDWASLEASFPGKPDFVGKLCKILLGSHSETPARLRTLNAHGDTEALKLLAHNLKGVAGNMMAGEVGALAAEICQQAKTGEPVAGNVLKLADAMERLLAEVEQYLAHQG
jgi:PAS domain S-box-containing protein